MDLQGSREAQVMYLLKQIKVAGLFLAPDIDDAYAKHWFNLYKHHNKLVGLHKPSGLYNGKIIFFKPSKKAPKFDVQMGNPIPAWGRVARAGIEAHDAPGNHFEMTSLDNTPVLVEMMKECIENFGV